MGEDVPTCMDMEMANLKQPLNGYPNGTAREQSVEENTIQDQEEEEAGKPPGIMSILCLVMLKKKLWLLPIFTAVWLFSSFWTSYGIAVSYNHTEANFPYISHTAIEAPERCVFGQMVNIGAVMLAMNVILRYLYVKKSLLNRHVSVKSRWYWTNIVSLVLGILSALGLSMVANFQTVVQRGPHYVGAGLAFGLGMIYCWVNSCLSWKVHYRPQARSRRNLIIVALQFINSFILTCLAVIFGSTKAVYRTRSEAGDGTKWDTLRGIYLTSTVTEWLLAVAILTFMLTYIEDFRHMRVDDPNIYLLPDKQTKSDSVAPSNNNDTTVTTTTPAVCIVMPPVEEVAKTANHTENG